LEGLEEDVIEMDEKERKFRRESAVGNDEDDDDDDGYKVKTKSKNKNDADENDNDENHLLNNNNNKNAVLKSNSVPTDKFYLELEKKFAIQNKLVYEKREQERLQTLFAAQLRQKQKEELKYQISTPKTALLTHRFLRLIFLFVHGINVGFQLWQAILVWILNTSDFKVNTSKYTSYLASVDSQYDASVSIFILFKKLTMPIHCITYLFVTICIVDTMDR
jgi:hypothetical protein